MARKTSSAVKHSSSAIKSYRQTAVEKAAHARKGKAGGCDACGGILTADVAAVWMFRLVIHI